MIDEEHVKLDHAHAEAVVVVHQVVSAGALDTYTHTVQRRSEKLKIIK